MALVLLTPIALDADSWQWLDLPDIQVARHEFPGHGKAPDQVPWPALTALADQVADVYPGCLDLVGVSMGGMVALHCALRHPARIRSLLVACTNAAADPGTMLARARAAEAGGMESVFADTLRRWFSPAALRQSPEHPGVGYARRALGGIAVSSFASAWRSIAGHDVRARLPEIRALTTCVAGRGDVASPTARIEEIARRIGHARLRLIDGPHMLQLERPDRFSAVLREHVRWTEETRP
jgi:pimeloyl-ACP methyl ester carboxylesterase